MYIISVFRSLGDLSINKCLVDLLYRNWELDSRSELRFQKLGLLESKRWLLSWRLLLAIGNPFCQCSGVPMWSLMHCGVRGVARMSLFKSPASLLP